jgi:hypothetical protein
MQYFMVFCSNLRNMSMILERQGITTGTLVSQGEEESTEMGKKQKPGW